MTTLPASVVRQRRVGVIQRNEKRYRDFPEVPVAPARKRAAGRHIVILVENLPVPFDRRPWQIAQTLVGQGHRVSVICPKMYEFTEARQQLEGVDIYRFPNTREAGTAVMWVVEYLNALLWMTLLCWRVFLTRGIDVVHACNPPDLLFLVAWPLRVFFGVKFIFDHHDLNPEVYLAKFGRKDLVYRVLCRLERMTYQLADAALATNESFRRIAVARTRKRAERIFIVRNAPMPGRFKDGPGRAELRRGKKHLVAYLGIMNRQDGLDLLLESIAAIVHRHGRRDVVFVLIGDGPEVTGLKQQAQKLNLNGEVQFVGRLSDGGAISDYLNTASVCVCPDPKNEMNDHSTMTKVVEYMAHGRPIVAYDLRETRYSAADSALYAADNDPRRFAELIVRLLDDERLRREMGRRGRERYRAMLSWERSRRELLRAYGTVLGK